MALYVIEVLECTELTAGSGSVQNLWVRMKGQTNNADVILGIYHTPPSQDNDAGDLLFVELGDASKSAALVLMGDLNLPEIN